MHITITLTGTEGLCGFWKALVVKSGFESLGMFVATRLQSGYVCRYISNNFKEYDMKKMILLAFFLLSSFFPIYLQTTDSSHSFISHFHNDGFMNFKFRENIDEIKNKLISIDGVEFVKTINGGLLFTGGEIEGEMVHTWEIFFADTMFAGLRLCFIDRKLFSKLEKSFMNEFGEYSNRQEIGPVIYISGKEKKMHDVILSWLLPEIAIELEEKIEGIGAFQTKVYLTYANIELASKLDLN